MSNYFLFLLKVQALVYIFKSAGSKNKLYFNKQQFF